MWWLGNGWMAGAALVADAPPWAMYDLGNLTATALLGWYAWHTASRTLPALVRAFREELAAQRRESADERQAFREELAEERLQRHADSLSLLEGLQTLSRQMGGRMEPDRPFSVLKERS